MTPSINDWRKALAKGETVRLVYRNAQGVLSTTKVTYTFHSHVEFYGRAPYWMRGMLWSNVITSTGSERTVLRSSLMPVNRVPVPLKKKEKTPS